MLSVRIARTFPPLVVTIFGAILGALCGFPLCPESISTSVLSLSAECINDSTAFDGRCDDGVSADGWRYAPDGGPDGLSGMGLGTNYESYGLALKEGSSEITIVVAGGIPLAGNPANVSGGTVAWGDLFLNFSGQSLPDASGSGTLFAVRFAPANDADVPEIGVYRDVSAKSVAAANSGPLSFQMYEDLVVARGGSVHYGPVCTNTAIDKNYFGPAVSLNVIASGTYAGPITPLTVEQLIADGFNPTNFPSTAQLIGFSFKRELLTLASWCVTPTPTPTATPTATPTPTATATPTPTPEPTAISPEGCVQMSTIGSSSGDLQISMSVCPTPTSLPCVMVNPTAKMKRIAAQLKGASAGVATSWAADSKRARANRGCRRVAERPLEAQSSRHISRVRNAINRHLLKPVRVCADSCIVRNFNREVGSVKQLISAFATDAGNLARDVVRCTSGSSRPAGAPRTENRLRDLVNQVGALSTQCRICRAR
jgi:hypothetical protein